MINANIVGDFTKMKMTTDLLGKDGDEMVQEIKADLKRQLEEGLQPPLKESSLKRPRRSKKPWDTLARRLWDSLTGYTSYSIIEKSKYKVSVGTKVPYMVYQARMGRDLGLTQTGANKVLNVFSNLVMGLLSRGKNK